MTGYAAFILTSEQSDRVKLYDAWFSDFLAQVVTIEFTKRDGSFRMMTGTVVEVKYTTDSSHAAVVLDTADGYRSANLWAISGARLGE